jgi:hypothetical protein
MALRCASLWSCSGPPDPIQWHFPPNDSFDPFLFSQYNQLSRRDSCKCFPQLALFPLGTRPNHIELKPFFCQDQFIPLFHAISPNQMTCLS